MSNQTNYDANIFFISELIRQLRRGTSINIDPDLYLDKIVEDLMFADDVLKTLYTKLTATELLVNREQYLRDLYLAKRDLTMLLDDLTGDPLEFSRYMKQYISRMQQIMRSQKEDMMAIDDLLNSENRREEEKVIVSQEEFSILLDDSEE